MPSANSSHPLLAKLNPVQREAVQHTDGPLLIFAGAGSGKTRVLTHRVAYLLAEKGVSPYQILAVTFTNKAAQEMRERIVHLVGEESRSIWIGTFHATCARILRESGDKIGLDRDFLIYDDGDQMTLVRECLAQLNLDDEKFAPRAVLSLISRAKERLITPEDYPNHYRGFFEDICGKVYELYRKKLRQNRALDFDDLLMMAVRLFEQRPDVLERYQNRFRYILVDEYQDVNYAQYVLLKRLAEKHRNLCVVGDDDQCVPAGTQIQTSEGPQPVECLREGSTVRGAAGWGEVASDAVNAITSRHYQGKLIHIRTDAGYELAATPNHLLFARIEPQSGLYYVYLMYRRGCGYRIGTTQGVRSRKASDQTVSDLTIRAHHEVADKIWILKTCSSSAEAGFYEQLFAFQYGIPTTVFPVRGRRMAMTSERVERLYQEIDTESRALRLMQDLLLCEEYPHHLPRAVIRGDSARKIVYFSMFGDHRTHIIRPWHAHRIHLVSSDPNLRRKVDAVYNTRNGRGPTWRTEISCKNYDEALDLAKRLMGMDDLELVCRSRLTEEQFYRFMPASHVHVGMKVPVHQEGRIVEATVTDVEWKDYAGAVFDLSVSNLRNYLANGLVVHNSIYGWRGADVGLILQFEKDYPETRVIKLEQNYRSTKTILEAAYGVVSNNRSRKDKRLWTENEEGRLLHRYEAENEQEEAVFVVQTIRRAVASGERRLGDFAILYRTNAQSRVFEEVFRNFSTPYKIVGGVRFYERKEVKDILAYLRVIHNPLDSVSLRRIINVPTRGIGATTLAALEAQAEQYECPLWDIVQEAHRVESLLPRARNAVVHFASLLLELRALRDKSSVTDLVQAVLDRTGYLQALEADRSIESQTRADNVKELRTVTTEFDATAEDRSLSAFLEQVSLVSDLDNLDAGADAVTMMTLHSAKGLEFPVVFLAGLEEGVFPHLRSMDSDRELEEERRLCYVGITRAKEEVYLSHAYRRTLSGSISYNPPSRFLQEIPDHLYRRPAVSGFAPVSDMALLSPPRSGESGRGAGGEGGRSEGTPVRKMWVSAPETPKQEKARASGANDFRPGQKVQHETFGIGIVVSVKSEGSDVQLSVAFPQAGVKKLLQSFAKLKKVP